MSAPPSSSITWATGAAGRDRFLGRADHRQRGEVAGRAARGDGAEQGGSLGAVAQAIGRVFDVAAVEHPAVAAEDGGADPEA